MIAPAIMSAVGASDGCSAADAELAAVAAEDELAYGSLEAAESYLGLAERGMASVPAVRDGQFQVMLGIDRLLLARQRGNLAALEDQARRLQALAEAPEAAQPALGEELRALALISVGITEYWTASFDQAER
jgi:LuxR family transcriptional regulator, maltose regulon positive regulatory protein